MRLGIDLGSSAVKLALLTPEGEIRALRVADSGARPAHVAQQLTSEICGDALPDRICATGYGRSLAEFAGRKITEITCHAAGVRHRHPDARTIIDIGGQDSKVIRLDDDGTVRDFVMNDKCAAGTGSFFDALARRFALEHGQIATLPAQAKQILPISATCVVFAESEIIGLLGEGAELEDILAGVYASVAQRIGRLYAQAGGEGPVYLSGGVAENAAMRTALIRELGVPVTPAEHAQLMGALGAALLA